MWKRRLLIAGSVLGLLLIGLHIYLGSSSMADQVRERLTRLLGVSVAVEQARIGLVRSSKVEGISAQERIPEATPLVRVRQATLDLTLFGVLGGRMPEVVDLSGVDLHLRFAATGKLLTTLPRFKPGGAALPAVHIHQGRIVLDQQERQPFALEGLDVTINHGADGYAIQGSLADPEWGDWSVEGTYRPDANLLLLRLKTPHAEVRQDMLRRLPFVSPSVWTAVEVDGTTGVDLTLRIPTDGSKPSYRVDLDVVRADVRVPVIELNAGTVAGRALIEDGIVQLQGVTGAYRGGRLETTARLDFSSPPSQLQFNIKAEDVRIEQLPRSWKLPEQLQGRVGMSADLLVRLEKPRAQMTGKGEGTINEVVFGDIAWVKPVGIKLTADGSRFQLRPVLPAFLSGPGRLLPTGP